MTDLKMDNKWIALTFVSAVDTRSFRKWLLCLLWTREVSESGGRADEISWFP